MCVIIEILFIKIRKTDNIRKLETYFNTCSIQNFEGIAHIIFCVTFQKIFTKPNLETFFILGFIFIAFIAKAVHSNSLGIQTQCSGKHKTTKTMKFFNNLL